MISIVVEIVENSGTKKKIKKKRKNPFWVLKMSKQFNRSSKTYLFKQSIDSFSFGIGCWIVLCGSLSFKLPIPPNA